MYYRLLTTHKIQELILKSFDFLSFINFIVCGKYEIIVHSDTIPNNTFPNMLFPPTNYSYNENEVHYTY